MESQRQSVKGLKEENVHYINLNVPLPGQSGLQGTMN